MTWTFKEMIKSIFKKTRADIASEKRQRVEADNNIMQQLNNAVNNGLANKVDKLSEDEITVSNAKNSESHNLTLNNNIAMLSYKDSLNNESQVVVSTTGVRLKEKSNINNNVTVSSTKSEVSHTDKVLLKAGDNVLQVDATDGLQISTDGGSTWGAVGGHLYMHAIRLESSSNYTEIHTKIINDTSSQFTIASLVAYLIAFQGNNYTDYEACGAQYSNSTLNPIIAIGGTQWNGISFRVKTGNSFSTVGEFSASRWSITDHVQPIM